MLSEQDKKDLKLIEKQFHKLICDIYHTSHPDFKLPSLDEAAKDIVDDPDSPTSESHFASTPGGGFECKIIRDKNGSLYLHASYSNRFCWGSEKEFHVRPDGYEDLLVTPTDVPEIVSTKPRDDDVVPAKPHDDDAVPTKPRNDNDEKGKKEGKCIIC